MHVDNMKVKFNIQALLNNPATRHGPASSTGDGIPASAAGFPYFSIFLRKDQVNITYPEPHILSFKFVELGQDRYPLN